MKEDKTLAVLLVKREDGTTVRRVAVLDHDQAQYWSDLLGKGDWKTAMDKAGSVFRMQMSEDQIEKLREKYTGEMVFMIPIIFGDEEDFSQIDLVRDDDLKL